MRRVLFASLAAASCWLAAAWPVRAEPEREALVRAGASVLKVEALRRQGGFALGSAVVVAPERVVTNCHVTHDATQVHLRRGELRLPVRAQAADLEHDLCLLQVPGLRAAAVERARSDALLPGQPVTALGYTGGLGLQSSGGRIAALHRLDGGRVVQSTNWFTSGASGGALFDDTMRLVGVLTFRLRGGEGHYFAAPTEWLDPLLAAPDERYAPIAPLPDEPLPYWQRKPERQPAFLQAAVLERDGNWAALEALALRWSAGAADDSAPLAAQGLALDRLNRIAEAQQALERAVERDPTAAVAWYRLAQLYTRQGNEARAREAIGRLAALDPEMAGELQAQRGKP